MAVELIARAVTIIFFSLILTSCRGGDSSSVSSSGTVSVSVTDAAVDNVKQVFVQFTGVTVKSENSNPHTLALSGDSQTCLDLVNGIGPTPTTEGDVTVRCIELKELQGTQSASLLDGIILSAGGYNWIRLDVDAQKGVMDSIVVENSGNLESLYIPSGSQSGLKLNSHFSVQAGGSHDFVIDFDLRKSVNNPQGFADYRLKPSLRMIDRALTGNITGTVDSTLLSAEGCTSDIDTGAGFAVYVYEGSAGTVTGEEGSENAPLTSAGIIWNADESSWNYTLGYLMPGNYTVAFTCQSAEDSPESAGDNIIITESDDSPTTVTAGQDSTVNFMP